MPEKNHTIPPEPRGWILPWAALLFFFSGATSLVYEVVWVKVLALEFGATAWSMSIVIASFMAGLGVGGFWGGRWAERFPRPILIYALLEAAVALYGWLSLSWLTGMHDVVGPLYRDWGGASGLFVLARFGLAFGVLFFPTFLMGASLPLLVVALAGHRHFRERVSWLYGINTLGAALGVLFAGLWALPRFGVRGTVAITVVLGLVIAVAALLLDRWGSSRLPKHPSMGASSRKPGKQILWLVTFAVFMGGGLSIAYQISWTRLLVTVVGSSTYAFTNILATFLVGIGLGGCAATLPLLHRFPPKLLLAASLGVTSLTVLAGLFVVNHLPSLFFELSHGLGDRVGQLLAAQTAIVAGLILVPTLAMGLGLPLAMAAWREDREERGEAVGGMISANTLGAIIGSLVAGFLLLPWLGPQGSIELAAVLGMGVAALLGIGSLPPGSRKKAWRVAGVGGAVLGLLLLLVPNPDHQEIHRGVFRSVMAQGEEQTRRDGDLIFSEVGVTSTVTVHRSPSSTSLRINGKVDATTSGDLETQLALGHLPLFLHPKPQGVCVIGFGSGATVHAVSTHPEVKEIDVVELEGAVLNAAPHFESVHHGVLEDARVSVHLEDGRGFLRYGEKAYDVIISEPSNPWMSGVSSLFTSEFYRMVRERLNPGGRFCQWVQFYELSQQTLQGMLYTLTSEFPHVMVFCTKSDLICVASDRPITTTMEASGARFSDPNISKSLARVQIEHPLELFSGLLRSHPEDRDLFEAEGPNTDDRLWLEYRAPLEMYRGLSPELVLLDIEDQLARMEKVLPGVSMKVNALSLGTAISRANPHFYPQIGALAELHHEDAKLSSSLAELHRATKDRVIARSKEPQRLAELDALINEKRLAEVAELSRRILKGDPTHNHAHRTLGWALIGQGKLREGAHHLGAALFYQPDDFDALARLTYLKKGSFETKKRDYEKALALHPQNYSTWVYYLRDMKDLSRDADVGMLFDQAELVLGPEASARLRRDLKAKAYP